MSEYVVGAAERDALGRASASVLAQRRAYFQRLESIAALADLGTAVSAGYRSTESLIADRDNLDLADAKRLVMEAADLCARSSLLGEKLPARLPRTGEALSAGLIDPAHVKIIRETMAHLSGLASPPPPDELPGVEETLAEKAQVLPPRMLRQLAKGFIDFYDPDGAAPPDGEASRDEMHLLRCKDGSLVFKGTLHDPLDAEAAVEVFGVLAAQCGADDERTLPRRQADAFKDLTQDACGPRGLATDARKEHDNPDPAGVEADAPTEADDEADDEAGGEALKGKGGYGTLDSGHHVDAATVRRWACDAEIIPMILGARSEPLDVGRSQRTAPDAIRRALNHRDGGCAFPGCTRRPRRCEAHHVQEWLQHRGATALDNMCLLCRYHHQLMHHGHWTIEMINGRPWFTPPWIIDTERRPRPGGRPRVPT
ncbi:uncharacterized protein DUF222 [Actinomycetospora succinea]|uniref:Uncharacterized protein DUF222 n=1 Tax=Actinomycetospora succinea TaxID=663603 RepID=A0A4R6VEB0_9PSEU|nr:HNH endonuclease signature motif containing protein [Actinomycetospora succinea]TDQ58770.1 uncharacterized protein DUF222 [Actinomycetospora succinea]